jgi:N-glycosylase/DNA lyase
MKTLKKEYLSIENIVEKRIKEFDQINEKADDKALLKELVFCLMTPQSKAKVCAKTADDIFKDDKVFKMSQQELSEAINNVRFKNNKSKYIKEALDIFSKTDIRKTLTQFKNAYDAREWLVKNVKGMGYKEASHFLRNIGFGYELAILDRHILKNLVKFGVISEIPKSINEKLYKEIEKKMQEFSHNIDIPMHHLDFLFWYKQTKEVFK